MDDARRSEERGIAPARRAVLATAVGHCVEWYDYAVYGYMAPTIAAVFFPSESPTASLLAAFAVFAVAFFARPLGGFAFGHLGDRSGRRPALVAVLLSMSVATVAMGLLPGYRTAGLLAPALLVVARLAQGFSAGGEYAGAASFVAESVPLRRRGFFGSWIAVSTACGLLLGSGTAAVLQYALTDAAVESWGWRLPFLLAGPLGAAGLWARLKLGETPEFGSLERTGRISPSPLKEAVVWYRGPVGLVMAVVLCNNAAFYVFLTYAPSYLSEELGYPSAAAFLSTTVALALYGAVLPLMGVLSDRAGRKLPIRASCLGLLVLTYPAFSLMSAGGLAGAFAAQAALGLALAAQTAVFPAFLAEMFPARVRYSALSVGNNLSVALFGGTAPFLSTLLISATGNGAAPAFYVMGAAVISLVALAGAAETFRVGPP